MLILNERLDIEFRCGFWKTSLNLGRHHAANCPHFESDWIEYRKSDINSRLGQTHLQLLCWQSRKMPGGRAGSAAAACWRVSESTGRRQHTMACVFSNVIAFLRGVLYLSITIHRRERKRGPSLFGLSLCWSYALTRAPVWRSCQWGSWRTVMLIESSTAWWSVAMARIKWALIISVRSWLLLRQLKVALRRLIVEKDRNIFLSQCNFLLKTSCQTSL